MAWNPILLVFNPYVTPMKVACLMSLIIQRKSKNRKYSRQILLVQARWALFILIRLWSAHQNTIKIRLHSAVFVAVINRSTYSTNCSLSAGSSVD